MYAGYIWCVTDFYERVVLIVFCPEGVYNEIKSRSQAGEDVCDQACATGWYIYEFDEKCYEALCRNNHGRKEGTGSENNDVETNPEDSCYTVMHGLSAGRKK